MYNCKLIKSRRRTISISIEHDGSITIRAPKGVKNHHIDSFLKEKRTWIAKNVAKMKERNERAKHLSNQLDAKKIKQHKEKAREFLTERVNYFAAQYNLKYNNIRLSSAKTRWGSCGSKNNLNFNWKIIFAPMQVIDYLVVHELAHTVYKNHQKRFWALVEKMHPEYKQSRKWLKANSHLLYV